MTRQIVELVERVLARAPQWICQDLASPDPVTRSRAEETLAAIVAAALIDVAADAG